MLYHQETEAMTTLTAALFGEIMSALVETETGWKELPGGGFDYLNEEYEWVEEQQLNLLTGRRVGATAHWKDWGSGDLGAVVRWWGVGRRMDECERRESLPDTADRLRETLGRVKAYAPWSDGEVFG